MDKEIIRLLKSAYPDDRIDGIERLVDSGHPDTLKILGSLYKKETDPQVKQLAAQMAREIKGAGASVSSSRRDPAAAKAHLESAMDAMIAFKNDEAWKWAKKAFHADPELAEDDYAVGLATEITGVDRTMAVETLMSGGGFIASEKPKRSEKSKISSDADRVGWGKALAGIGVYALLNALAVAIPVGIFGATFMAFIAYLADEPEMASMSGATFAIIAIIAGIGTIIGVFISVFIQYGLIHFSATTFLGGKGYFTNLLWNLRIPLIAQFIVQAVIGGLMIFFMFSSLMDFDPVAFEAAMATGDSSYLTEDNSTNIINILNSINGLIGLGFIFWISMIIGKTYDFGGGKGCLSMIISYLVMMVAICGCYFAIFMTIIGSVDTSGF